MKEKEKVNLILKCVALAMGVAVIVLGKLGEVNATDSIVMLGIGLSLLAISLIGESKK